MTRFLLAAASPETVAAACDYIEPKLVDGAGRGSTADRNAERSDDGDEVYVLTVEEEARPLADRGNISRVAQERLADRASVRTIHREGTPEREIVTFARNREVDEIVLGPSRGTRGSIGSTTKAVLAEVEMPVFVVPH